MHRMIRTTAMAAVLAFGLAGTAQAQDIKPYVGAGIGMFNLDAGLGSGNALGFFIDGGVDVNQYLAAELRYGATGDATVNVAGVSTTNTVNYFFSYFGKLQYPFGNGLTAYALLGGTSLKTTFAIPGFASISNTTADFSYGIGAQYQIADQLKAGIEWVRYAKDANAYIAFPGLDVYGISATINYNF